MVFLLLSVLSFSDDVSFNLSNFFMWELIADCTVIGAIWNLGSVSVLACNDVINIAECSWFFCGKLLKVLKLKSDKSDVVLALPKISVFGGQQEHNDKPKKHKILLKTTVKFTHWFWIILK